MAYTSFQEMSRFFTERFGVSCGPAEPTLFTGGNGCDLKSAALRFLRDGCEELRFGPVSAVEELRSGKLTGTSLKQGQIPGNMEKDIDRLCLEKALEVFIDSGTAEDAYAVYYCYLEMFIGSYGSTKTMVELLSEFERNGSSLLMKHRDHYSHSVYVFALGLAIYECNPAFRSAFKRFYHYSEDEDDREGTLQANHAYLRTWGLTALFHDIGYPFELPFEQVMSYFEVDKTSRSSGIPFLAYRSLDAFLNLSGPEQAHFRTLYGFGFSSLTEVLAHNLYLRMGKDYGVSESYLFGKISDKPVHPENFSYYMDHAFFSACRLYRSLCDAIGVDSIDETTVDALSAILLHNSLFKFCIAFYKSAPPEKRPPLPMDLHPLAYMLMLCDELQCWDRTSYGRDSRITLYPMSADFDFSNGGIAATYHYNRAFAHKIDAYDKERQAYEAAPKGKKPRLKAYSDMCGSPEHNDFAEDIRNIVDLTSVPFSVVPDTVPEDRSKKHTYLSGSNFLHLFDFAVLLSARHKEENIEQAKVEDWIPAFDSMSLEYKLNHMERAKYFGRYLNSIGCFYTDRPVDFNLLESFDARQMERIAPMEHERWLENHVRLGWVNGNLYEKLPLGGTEDEVKAERARLREQLRCHKLLQAGELTHEKAMAHFEDLPESEKGKDCEPMNTLLKIMRRLDGVQIYSLGIRGETADTTD